MVHPPAQSGQLRRTTTGARCGVLRGEEGKGRAPPVPREIYLPTSPQVVAENADDVLDSALNIGVELLHLGRSEAPTVGVHYRQEAPHDHRNPARSEGSRQARPAKPAKATAPKQPAKVPAEGKAEAPAAPAPTSLLEALAQRTAVLVKVRANGTRRSLPYLAPGTPERAAAEAVAARVAKGETLPAIATDLKVSLATARRFLTNLTLAQDVEAGKHDTAWKPGTKEVVVHIVRTSK